MEKKLIKLKLGNCFLITPIGASTSQDRLRVDQWMDLIYIPAIKNKYNLVRADLISTPGTITKQVIDYIIDAELVIVDFTPSFKDTNPNANVMYEAAIRHLAHKPVIHIAPHDLPIPFDIKDFRSILYSKDDLDYPNKLKKALVASIKAVNDPGYKTPDIIGHTFDFDRITSDPVKFIQLLKDMLYPNGQGLTRVEDSYSGGVPMKPISYRDLSSAYGSLASIRTTSYPPICPNCGRNQTVLISPFGAYSGTSQQYKCTNCGISFFN